MNIIIVINAIGILIKILKNVDKNSKWRLVCIKNQEKKISVFVKSTEMKDLLKKKIIDKKKLKDFIKQYKKYE